MAPELLIGPTPASKETDMESLEMMLVEVNRVLAFSRCIADRIPNVDNNNAAAIF